MLNLIKRFATRIARQWKNSEKITKPHQKFAAWFIILSLPCICISSVFFKSVNVWIIFSMAVMALGYLVGYWLKCKHRELD